MKMQLIKLRDTKEPQTGAKGKLQELHPSNRYILSL